MLTVEGIHREKIIVHLGCSVNVPLLLNTPPGEFIPLPPRIECHHLANSGGKRQINISVLGGSTLSQLSLCSRKALVLDHAAGEPSEREACNAHPGHRLGVPSPTFCLFVLQCLFFYPHPSSFSAWLRALNRRLKGPKADFLSETLLKPS